MSKAYLRSVQRYIRILTIASVEYWYETDGVVGSLIQLWKVLVKSSSSLSGVVMPIFLRAAALHCCSYCPWMGMAIIFFFRCRASAGVSNPAPQMMPSQWMRLRLKSFELTGRRVI